MEGVMPKELVARWVAVDEETKVQDHTDVLVRWGGEGPMVEVRFTRWGRDYYDGHPDAKPTRVSGHVSQALAWHEVNNLIKALRKARDAEYGPAE
jgi:hypothetical protein